MGHVWDTERTLACPLRLASALVGVAWLVEYSRRESLAARRAGHNQEVLAGDKSHIGTLKSWS
jgi:hypothetical protein